jgi:tRNA threonylcarbamoyladenosine modification (KEOPS) complex  Pcc1 subunit
MPAGRTSTLVLEVTAQDTAALRAALNMVLRLVNVADEMQEPGKKTLIPRFGEGSSPEEAAR